MVPEPFCQLLSALQQLVGLNRLRRRQHNSDWQLELAFTYKAYQFSDFRLHQVRPSAGITVYAEAVGELALLLLESIARSGDTAKQAN